MKKFIILMLISISYNSMAVCEDEMQGVGGNYIDATIQVDNISSGSNHT